MKRNSSVLLSLLVLLSSSQLSAQEKKESTKSGCPFHTQNKDAQLKTYATDVYNRSCQIIDSTKSRKTVTRAKRIQSDKEIKNILKQAAAKGYAAKKVYREASLIAQEEHDEVTELVLYFLSKDSVKKWFREHPVLSIGMFAGLSIVSTWGGKKIWNWWFAQKANTNNQNDQENNSFDDVIEELEGHQENSRNTNQDDQDKNNDDQDGNANQDQDNADNENDENDINQDNAEPNNDANAAKEDAQLDEKKNVDADIGDQNDQSALDTPDTNDKQHEQANRKQEKKSDQPVIEKDVSSEKRQKSDQKKNEAKSTNITPQPVVHLDSKQHKKIVDVPSGNQVQENEKTEKPDPDYVKKPKKRKSREINFLDGDSDDENELNDKMLDSAFSNVKKRAKTLQRQKGIGEKTKPTTNENPKKKDLKNNEPSTLKTIKEELELPEGVEKKTLLSQGTIPIAQAQKEHKRKKLHQREPSDVRGPKDISLPPSQQKQTPPPVPHSKRPKVEKKSYKDAVKSNQKGKHASKKSKSVSKKEKKHKKSKKSKKKK